MRKQLADDAEAKVYERSLGSISSSYLLPGLLEDVEEVVFKLICGCVAVCRVAHKNLRDYFFCVLVRLEKQILKSRQQIFVWPTGTECRLSARVMIPLSKAHPVVVGAGH